MRRAGAVLGLLALAVSALVGGNVLGLRERLFGRATPEPRPPAVSREAGEPLPTQAPEPTVLRSQPWWQHVEDFEGQGASTLGPFSIDEGALQWRVSWTCRTGQLVVRAPGLAEPIVDASCPGSDSGYAVETGGFRLQVAADASWDLEVEQQIDVPLVEPPLPAMTAPGADVVATGSLYRIDRVGRGKLTLYRLAEGGHALRLEDLYVSPNVDLELRLSPLPQPKTTEQFLSRPSVRVAMLPVTAGAMNFSVPDSVNPSRYRSLVVWCEPLRTAYAAAALDFRG